MAVIDLPVKGMTCQACEVRISKALGTVPGVLRASGAMALRIRSAMSPGALCLSFCPKRAFVRSGYFQKEKACRNWTLKGKIAVWEP